MKNPIIKGIEDTLKSGFNTVSKGTGKGLDQGGNAIKEVLNVGEKVAGSALGIAEKVVGKERLEGATLGAKVGGTIGMIGGVPGMVKGGVVGAAIGFVGGQKVVDWYHRDRKAEQNDNPKPDEPSKDVVKTPETPKDPAP